MTNLKDLKITLVDRKLILVETWQQAFSYEPKVDIKFSSILDLNVDCIVSPANSFGFMDGGIDCVYSSFQYRNILYSERYSKSNQRISSRRITCR